MENKGGIVGSVEGVVGAAAERVERVEFPAVGKVVEAPVQDVQEKVGEVQGGSVASYMPPGAAAEEEPVVKNTVSDELVGKDMRKDYAEVAASIVKKTKGDPALELEQIADAKAAYLKDNFDRVIGGNG